MLILMTNHRPHAPIDDFAFWKRIKNVHFPLAFVAEPAAPNERRADPKIAEKLKAEAPGILRWLVEGCLDYQKYGLTEPAAVREANAEYLREEDLTGLFIDECCTLCPGAEVSTKALYAAYKSWTQENNHRAISGTAFGRYVGARFEKGSTGKTRFYKGISLVK